MSSHHCVRWMDFFSELAESTISFYPMPIINICIYREVRGLWSVGSGAWALELRWAFLTNQWCTKPICGYQSRGDPTPSIWVAFVRNRYSSGGGGLQWNACPIKTKPSLSRLRSLPARGPLANQQKINTTINFPFAIVENQAHALAAIRLHRSLRALNLALAAASLEIKASRAARQYSWSARLRSIHKEDAAEDSGCHLFAKHGLGQSDAEVLVGEIEHDDHRVTHKTRVVHKY